MLRAPCSSPAPRSRPEPRSARRRRLRLALAASSWACAAALAAWPSAARATEPETPETDEVRWQPAWPRVGIAEYVVTGTMLGGVAVGLFALPQRADAWEGGILFDDALRDEVVLGNRGDRETAVLVGDVLYYGLSAYPLVIDVGVAALAVHRDPEVAWQMFAIDAQAFALTGLVSTFTQKLVGRDRPFADRCAGDPEYDHDCDDPANRSQSFISGHTAMAFTGASLICLHHAHLPLYGGGAPDLLACSLAQAGAVGVAVSRIVADRHYFSDALAGASLGLLSGLILPELLHYHFGGPAFALTLRSEAATIALVPLVTPSESGLAATGSF